MGDQFFLPDSSQFYFNDLPGEKYLRYVPNVGHSLKGSDAWETLFAYYAMLLADKPRPTFAWKANGDETLVVTPTDKPAEVRLWQATNPKARDFRKDTLGPVWTSEVLQANAAGEFVGTVPKPAEGWTAFMVELTYPTPAKVPLKFTTDVHVTPTTLPFPPFKPSKTD